MAEGARRYLVVWNPDAGRKAGLPTNTTDEETLRRTMAESGLGTDLFVAESEGATTARVKRAIDDGWDVVVAAGGDGTAGRIAKQLIGTDVALAVLPLGSAMNIARSLGIPRDLPAAARIAATAPIRTIDVGEAEGRTFFEIASIGLNAAMFEQAQLIDRGRYSSLVGLARVILRFRPARVRMTLDGRRVQMRALMIAVANAPYTGLGLTLAPQARLDDGLFDVTVYNGLSRWELIRHLGAIAAGRHRYSPRVRTFRARRVTVDARRRLPVRVDAEDLGTTPASFEIRPGALRVVAPATLSAKDPDERKESADEDRGTP